MKFAQMDVKYISNHIAEIQKSLSSIQNYLNGLEQQQEKKQPMPRAMLIESDTIALDERIKLLREMIKDRSKDVPRHPKEMGTYVLQHAGLKSIENITEDEFKKIIAAVKALEYWIVD